MAVSQKVADSLADQLQGWNPDVPSVGAPQASVPSGAGSGAQPGWSIGETLSEGGKELASAGMKGFLTAADFLKGTVVGLAELAAPEGSPYMNIAGVTLPRLPESGPVAKLLQPWEPAMLPEAKKRAEAPKTMIGKIGNPMAEGVGAMAAMPMGGGVVRNIVAGMGMGELADIGKKVMGPIFAYFDPSLRSTGEAVGAIGGGMAGSQLNITKAQAVMAAGQTAFKYPAMAVDAYKSARAAQRAGDTRRLHEIFADEFGSLRASTQGLIEQYTNQVLADLIRRDYQATAEAERFVKDAATTGINQKPWGLGERTLVPAVVEIAAKRIPKTAEESAAIAEAAGQRRQSIVNVYNNLMGSKIPADAQGVEAAAKTLQAVTQAKVDAMSAEMGLVKAKFPDLSPQMQYAIGEKVREVRDQLNRASLDVARGRYTEAEQAFEAEGARIGLGDVREKAQAILREFVAQAAPQEVPPIVRSVLGATTVEKAARGPELILPADLAAERAAAAAAPKVKEVSLKDANDLVRALSTQASRYRAAERFQDFSNTKMVEQELLNAISGAKVSPETMALYDRARAYWATEHAPRFLEGMGKALGREKGGVLEGREAVVAENVMPKFIADGETGMREFDRVFGNNQTARTALGATLEGQFRSNVLNSAKTPEALEKALYQFKLEKAAALSRFPQIADKVEQRSAETLALMKAQETEIARYKNLMGGDVAKSVGPLQAKFLFERALADPVKMDQLLAALPKGKGDAAANMVKELFTQAHPFKNGEYDPGALFQLLNAGKDSAAQKSSMEKLFTAAWGPEQAKRHMDVLEALGNFVKREAVTNPQNLRPESLLSDQPFREQTGSSLASWIALFRANAAGMIGAPYATMVGVSRFANAKAQAAVEAAKMKALYDPETADAILKMASTPATTPLGLSTAKKIWGNLKMPNGQNMVDYLVDRGYVKDYAVRGGIYGVEQSIGQREERR